MKLNKIERFLMNNPVRALVQRNYEAAVMQRLGGRCNGKRALEIGCGQGVGTEIILERFGATEVHAFDLDPKMVEIAKVRLARHPAKKLSLFVCSADSIAAPDASYDAVFDFGIIHHIPKWQRAIAEVSRVLRPGGTFYFEEVTAKALRRWSYRTFLEHPTENRFAPSDLIAELTRNNIHVGNRLHHWLFGDIIIGVGNRSSALGQ